MDHRCYNVIKLCHSGPRSKDRATGSNGNSSLEISCAVGIHSMFLIRVISFSSLQFHKVRPRMKRTECTALQGRAKNEGDRMQHAILVDGWMVPSRS